MSSSVVANAESGPDSEKLAWFTTTHWSVVITAKEGSETLAADALDKLCRTYWPPLYTFIRREGYGPSDAQDLTQEFFGKLLARDYLSHLKHQNGRFRSFLLTFVKHFLSDQRDKARAQKRGGGKIPVSLDDAQSQERAWMEPRSEDNPETLFERRWAQTVLEEAAARLAEEYETEGKGDLFRRMKEFQPGVRGEHGYAKVATEVNMSENALKTAIHRMRRRHSQKLREVVANTVGNPSEINDELRHLMSILGS